MLDNISTKLADNPSPDSVADTVSGLFSTLADAMPQFVWATDADGSHFYFNRRWYEYTGMTEADSLGFGFVNPLHPDDLERTLARWRQAWEAGEDYDIEYRFRRHDGVYRWFVGRAMPVRDAATGAVRMWIGTCTDIDDSHRILDELRESQSRLAIAVQSAKLGMWEYDEAGSCILADAASSELFQVAPGEPLAVNDWRERIHETDRERIVAVFGDYLRKLPPYDAPDTVYSEQYRVRRADHTVRWVSALGTRLPGSGDNGGRIVGVLRDITDERNTLDALRESAESLRESESRFRTVIGNAPITAFALDKDGMFTFSDGAGLASIGLKPGEVVGRSAWDVYADFPELTANLRRALDGESVSWNVPVNGIVFEMRCSPVMNDDGEPDGIIGVAFDVTEKTRAADELAAREEHYRFLFNTVASGVVYQDGDARILDANPAAERILGLTLAQMTGRDSFDPRWRTVREDGSDLPGDEHPGPVALRTGRSVRDVPMGVFHPDENRYRWLSVSAVPLTRPGEAKPYLVYAYFEDHTERREAERLSRESEERFRALADNISQLAWMGDRDGSLFWYNRRWFDYTGTTIDEMRGWGWRAVHHPDYVGPVTARFADHMARGAEWEDTFPLRGADGEYRWFLSRAVPLRDAAGNIMRWFGTNTDVTESRRAEEEVRRSEERFRSLTTATAQIVWTTDAGGAFAAEQPGWAAFTGQSYDEYAGLGWLEAIHEDDHEETTRLWREAVATRSSFVGEHRLRHADETYRYMSVRAVPVPAVGGAVREWVGVHTDITDRKEAEFALSEYATKQARVAETLQRSLLSTPPGNAFPGIIVSTEYEPALDEAQVGGDFFDVFALRNSRVALVVGDVTGKGLKAAEHTGQIKYALRAFLRENPDPGIALARLNRLLTDAEELDPQAGGSEDSNAMAAITVAVLETGSGELQVAGGGVEFPLWWHASTGACEEIRTRGLVIGAYEESKYDTIPHRMEPGDLLVLCTDGITESRRGRHDFFGNEGVAEQVESTARRTSDPDAIARGIMGAARSYSDSGTFRDDVCLLVARRHG